MKKFFPILILLIGIFFRIYRLGSVPPSPSLDEVSIGWNAYSILKTGKDEYGYRLPVLLRAYDDWRPALYVYLVIPFVKILGLNIFSVRVPAVVLSLVTILATYFLTKELFLNSPLANKYALIASALLAVSPWHIYLSRLGHEVGAGLAFSVLGLLFFLKFSFFLSALFFVLCLYTYQSQKIFTPLLLVFLAIIFQKELIKKWKSVLVIIFLALILLFPLFQATFSSGGLARARGASIFTNPPENYYQANERILRDRINNWLLGRVFDNPRLTLAFYVFRAYFSHFDPVWLFFHKLEERHKVPSLGLFYLWELPLILVGGYQMVKGKFSRKTKAIIFGWLLLGPLPAALATQAPHGMRAINMLPMVQIIAAVGVVSLMNKLRLRKNLTFAFIVMLFFISMGFFYHNYFFNFPYEQSDSFQYPLSQAIPYVLSIQNQYDKIVFSERGQLEQSYMFFLFFSKTDPIWYQKQGGTISGGFNQEHYFGKYEFRYIDWNKENQKPPTGKTLYVGNMLSAIPDLPEGVAGLKIFKLLDGREAIKIVAR